MIYLITFASHWSCDYVMPNLEGVVTRVLMCCGVNEMNQKVDYDSTFETLDLF